MTIGFLRSLFDVDHMLHQWTTRRRHVVALCSLIKVL
jgi:hypothetical protein